MSHSSSHLAKASRSACSDLASFGDLILRSTAVSSANSLVFDLTREGRSLMYARNRHGPRTEPCGTPDLDLAGFTAVDNNGLLPVS